MKNQQKNLNDIDFVTDLTLSEQEEVKGGFSGSKLSGVTLKADDGPISNGPSTPIEWPPEPPGPPWLPKDPQAQTTLILVISNPKTGLKL